VIKGTIQLPLNLSGGEWLLAAIDAQQMSNQLKDFAEGSTDTLSFILSANEVTVEASTDAVGPGTYEDNHPAITYVGKWTHVNLQAANRGSYRKSGEPGATASLVVKGAKNFRIMTSTANNRGIANVLVDGNVVGTIDAYSPTTAYKVPFGPYPLDGTGRHTIELQVTGSKNPNSKNTTVTLDNFVVSKGTKKFEDKSAKVIYGGDWKLVNLDKASGGTLHKSSKPGATASLEIGGAKSFKITTSTARNRGIANVLVDGNVVGTIDAYGPTGYKVQFGPYPLNATGQQTITLQVTGTKNPSSKSTTVTLDNILITYP
jgi:hypothetical protein